MKISLANANETRPKRSLSITEERRRMQKIFMIPIIITLLVMIIVPLIALFIFSFTSVKVGMADFNFIGLQNYKSLISDKDFLIALANTLIMLTGTVALQLFLGTVYALIMHKTQFLSGAIRIIMMLPMVISPIVAGLIWKIMLMPKYGGLNMFLASFGVKNIPNWFGDPIISKIVIIIVAAWEWTPFVILYILAGLEGLPSSPFEAAKVDGANWFQEIWTVTLPMLKNLFVVVILFRVIEAFKLFPLIYSITSGGPGNATEDLTYLVYKGGFKYLKLGYASTVSMIILFIICILIILMNVTNKRAVQNSKKGGGQA